MSSDIKPYDHQEHLEDRAHYHWGVANFCFVIGVVAGLVSIAIIMGMVNDPNPPVAVLVPTILGASFAASCLFTAAANYVTAHKASKGASNERDQKVQSAT